jgi:sugar lactone lactonase YvrE
MNHTSRSRLFFASVLTLASILLASTAVAQTAPPMLVQVPWVSVAVGNITSAGAAATTLPAACTTGLPIMGTSTTGTPTAADNYGDGCLPSLAITTTPWGNAVDAWGNIYFSDEGHKYVRVVYAGAVTVGGVLNPAGAMISAAYGNRGVTPVAGNVYGVAGGYTAALAGSAAPYYCYNNGAGLVAGTADGANCPATFSYISGPYSPAVDSAGNLFIADKSNKVLYEVVANASSLGAQLVTLENPTITTPLVGYIYKLASGSSSTPYYSDKVLASTSAAISIPYGVAVDASENLYITDYTNNAIRMINGPNTTSSMANSGGVGPGFIHTIAGYNCVASTGCTALSGAPGSGVPAVSSSNASSALLDPLAIVVDAYGNVYFGDNSAAVTTVPSSVRVIYAGGTNNPVGNLICQENPSISNCSTSLVANDVYTLAGSGNAGTSTAATGNGALATTTFVSGTGGVRFEKIQGLALDSHGNIYIADYSSSGLIAEINANTGLLTFISGGSPSTLAIGNNCASGATAGNGPIMTDAYGDGCPATESKQDHLEGNPAFDASGNLYFSDSGYGLIRKLTFNSAFTATAVGTPSTQNFAFELLTAASAGTTGYTASSTGTPVAVLTQGTASAEFTNAGGAADTCTAAMTAATPTLTGFPSNATGTASSSTAITTCVVPVTFTPTKAGIRSGAVQVTATINGNKVVMNPAYLSGTGLAAELVIDPSAATMIGSGTAPQGVATDAAGNTYIAWANGTVSSTPAGTLATAITGNTSNPHQIAVDGFGNVFVADTGGGRIAEFAVGASSAVTAVGGLNAPQGVAVDAAGNLYIADTGNSRVLFQPINSGLQTTLGISFQTPVAVAVDAAGNVYVADSGQGKIYKILPGYSGQVTVASGINPVGLAVDAAGGIEYLDSAAKTAVNIPEGGALAFVVTGLNSPIGMALDQNGGLYVADSAKAGVSYYNRLASTQNFASLATTLGATLTNVGNQTFTSSSIPQTDSTDFTVIDAASNGCSGLTSLSLYPGGNCALTANFTPVATGNLSNTMTFNGNSILSAPTLTLTGYNAAPVSATTTTLSSTTPAAPVFGQSVQITATVTPTTGTNTPTGTLIFTVDGVAQSVVTLNNSGASTLTMSGLAAGQHTVAAAYTPTGNFTASATATAATFTVAPLTMTVTPPAAEVYGQSAAFSTLVSAATGTTPSGALTYSIDSGTAQAATLTGGAYTLSVAGLTAGSHSVTATFTPTSYTNSQSTTAQSFTVAAIALTVAPPSQTATYGQSAAISVPSISGANVAGVLAADQANLTVHFATTATNTSSVGSYPITLASTALTGSAAGNYTVRLSNSPTVTIQAATVTLTVANATKAYGAALPTLTGTFGGALAADLANLSANFSTTATATSAVGSYPITASALSGTAASNYTLGTVTNGQLSVTALAVTVAPPSVTATYGQATAIAIPSITGASIAGVLTPDQANVTANFTTAATTTSPVGKYPITLATPALTGSAAGNYTVTLSNSPTVTLGTATITVVVNSATRSYGAANPTFTGTLTGVVGTDNVAAVYSTTATVTSAVGSYPITVASLSGSSATNYTLGTVTAGALAVTQTSTTTALVATPASIGEGSTATFTATVTSATSGTPTGSVAFSNGTTSLGSVTLTAGVASYSTTSLPVGVQSITAVYQGSSNFLGSTSAAVNETVVVPIVTATPSTSNLSITSGSTGTVTLTVAAVGGYTGTATYSCALLPADMSCSFAPATATFTSSNTTASTVLTISTKPTAATTAAQLTQPHRPGGSGSMPLLAVIGLWIPGIFAGFLGLGKGRRGWRSLTMIVLFVIGCAAMAGITGCGGGSGATQTPAGTYNIEVEITAGTIQVVPLTIVVQ